MERASKKIVPDVIDPKKVSHVFVSPRQRAQQTADILFNHDAKTTFKAFETTEDIAEWDYGAYEGLKTKEIKQMKPDWFIWKDGCPPGKDHPGESVQQMQDRVDRIIARIKGVHAECMARENRDGRAQDVVIVSHGHFSRVFIARWCDLPLEMGYHFSCDAGGLNILGYQHNTLKEPSLIGLNWFSEDRS